VGLRGPASGDDDLRTAWRAPDDAPTARMEDEPIKEQSSDPPTCAERRSSGSVTPLAPGIRTIAWRKIEHQHREGCVIRLTDCRLLLAAKPGDAAVWMNANVGLDSGVGLHEVPARAAAWGPVARSS